MMKLDLRHAGHCSVCQLITPVTVEPSKHAEDSLHISSMRDDMQQPDGHQCKLARSTLIVVADAMPPVHWICGTVDSDTVRTEDTIRR